MNECGVTADPDMQDFISAHGLLSTNADARIHMNICHSRTLKGFCSFELPQMNSLIVFNYDNCNKKTSEDVFWLNLLTRNVHIQYKPELTAVSANCDNLPRDIMPRNTKSVLN